MKGAVFLDRDGVINEEVHLLYKTEDLRLIPKSAEAIARLNKEYIKTILITNQPAIGRGLCSEKDLEKIHAELSKLLNQYNAHIDSIYYCPHHPLHGIGKYKIECDCRKPKPGLLLKAAEEDKEIDLNFSYMIGDRISDIKAGKLAGCTTIGVRTGYGCKDPYNDAIPDIMADNLFHAVGIILKMNKENDN